MHKYVALVVGLLVCALAAWALWHGAAGNVSVNAAAPSATSSAQVPPRVPPAGSREYHNATYHFSLLYPQSMTIQEYTDPSGYTVAFSDSQSNNQFEVYITPYALPQIVKARFLLDEPSGVIQDPTQVLIDNVSATMFFGQNDVVGATREVWFTHGGYLYEVTTTKDLDSWLSQIMTTWQFI